MGNSSQQDLYSITLNDTITIDPSSWTMDSSLDTASISNISITGSNGSGYIGATGSSGTYTISSGTVPGTYSINEWSNGKEFVDCLPSFSRIEAMCKEFPGLAIAFEKFKTTYYLVKDEYDNPKDKK